MIDHKAVYTREADMEKRSSKIEATDIYVLKIKYEQCFEILNRAEMGNVDVGRINWKLLFDIYLTQNSISRKRNTFE